MARSQFVPQVSQPVSHRDLQGRGQGWAKKGRRKKGDEGRNDSDEKKEGRKEGQEGRKAVELRRNGLEDRGWKEGTDLRMESGRKERS